jgi:hypothetical protein
LVLRKQSDDFLLYNNPWLGLVAMIRKKNKGVCVTLWVGLAIHIEKYLKGKRRIMEIQKNISPCKKYNLQKKTL